MKEYILTVMARDRVGIIRDVSSALTRVNGNITYVRQTVMRGYFTLIMSVEMPDERTHLEIKQAVERSGEVGELEVNVRPYIAPSPIKPQPCERFTLSLRGNDQKGIICRVTSYLAERNINIDDFFATVMDGKFAYLFQVSIPVGVDVEALQSELALLGVEYGLTVHLQHENVFKATNEVQPVMHLQREG